MSSIVVSPHLALNLMAASCTFLLFLLVPLESLYGCDDEFMKGYKWFRVGPTDSHSHPPTSPTSGLGPSPFLLFTMLTPAAVASLSPANAWAGARAATAVTKLGATRASLMNDRRVARRAVERDGRGEGRRRLKEEQLQSVTTSSKAREYILF